MRRSAIITLLPMFSDSLHQEEECLEGQRRKNSRGLKAVAAENGVISAAAMDQRGSLHKSIAKEKGVETKAITPERLSVAAPFSRGYVSRHSTVPPGVRLSRP
jgi:hypothetical protein